MSVLKYEELSVCDLAARIKDDGYFIVNNLPKELKYCISHLLEEGTTFFSSESEFKESHKSIEDGIDVGYSHTRNVKEAFQVRLSKDPLIHWTATDFKSALETCYQELQNFAHSILFDMGKNINIDASDIKLGLDPLENVPASYISSSVLDLFNYFNTNENCTEPCRPHTDAGLLTVVPCALEPGLQIFDVKTNEWIDVERICKDLNEVCLVVFAGDSLSVFSDRQLPPTLHRVFKSNSSRLSLVFKLRARIEIAGPRSEADYKIMTRQMAALNKM